MNNEKCRVTPEPKQIKTIIPEEKPAHFEIKPQRGKATFKVQYIETNRKEGCRFCRD